MPYKTNYEPYNSVDFDMERERSSEEVLYPLIDLYPHVVALQLQADGQHFNRSDSDSGYHSINYWSDSSPTRSTFEEESRTSRKSNESTKDRFVSKIRKILCQNDLRRRTNSN
ncbi:uncharacterized protein EURHEDRAFT_457790 [Aspergillus ruber CBS 135680]|uniref:Uncharacterized protein n=1 Tax=Aspergillus ruber (strain CBS 135680) TaxID=1388766 RepID=A0A017SCB5_ASPRC|nr:uncharacterized protein EURHEDRAFT_457790 [Aspergillus ruber CBS 135680]EYE94537.1 hypothetical protein EURHEDRAFT_457790 [Aspergillus ruber CBS 135680]